MRFSVMHGKTYGPMRQDDREVLSKIPTAYNVSKHAMRGTLPAEFVDRYAIVGPPEECIRRLRQIIDLGIDRILVFGPTVDEVEGDRKVAADLMVKKVLPAFGK